MIASPDDPALTPRPPRHPRRATYGAGRAAWRRSPASQEPGVDRPGPRVQRSDRVRWTPSRRTKINHGDVRWCRATRGPKAAPACARDAVRRPAPSSAKACGRNRWPLITDGRFSGTWGMIHRTGSAWKSVACSHAGGGERFNHRGCSQLLIQLNVDADATAIAARLCRSGFSPPPHTPKGVMLKFALLASSASQAQWR